MGGKTLPTVPYHRQEGEDFCGAACLQMVIEALGRGSRTQAQLFADAQAHGVLDPTPNWDSPPDGVQWALQNRAAVKEGDADVTSPKQEATLTRQLVWSLFNASVPPLVVVYGSEHWVVVVGYDISRDPTSPSDTGYVIKALDIHDPWRTLEEGLPPPPPPPRHVTFRQWQRKYLKPMPNGHWKGSVVGVGVFTE